MDKPGQFVAPAAPAHDVRKNAAKSSNKVVSRLYGRFAMNKECLRNVRVNFAAFRLRNRIIPTRIKWMAATNAF